MKYNYLKTQPYVAALVFTTLLLLFIACFSPNLQIKYICFVFAFLCIALMPIKKTVWSNDYLVAVKYPLLKSFYLYQRIKKKKLKQMKCKKIYNDYFAELNKVIQNFPVGSYITVTQPMFTRGLRNNKNIRVLTLEKSYQKKIRNLHSTVFLNRCKKCAGVNCPAHISNNYKQFYYIEFSVWYKRG